MQLDNPESEQHMYLSPSFEIMKLMLMRFENEEDRDIYEGVLDGLCFAFPTPFHKGDIVWNPECPSVKSFCGGPLVLNEIPNNYALTKYETGTYTIEKATVVPVLSPKTFIYSGKEYAMTCDNLDLPLRFVYKQFGMVVDSVINAGTYKVQAYFDGNENYNSSASAETDLVIEQQGGII